MAKVFSTESQREEMKVQRKPDVGIWKELEIGLQVGDTCMKPTIDSPPTKNGKRPARGMVVPLPSLVRELKGESTKCFCYKPLASLGELNSHSCSISTGNAARLGRSRPEAGF
jgi:hypothetical protein